MTMTMLAETSAESVAVSRKARCRLLDRNLNRCANESLSEDGVQLCAAHYAKAVADFCRLTGGKLSLIAPAGDA